MAKHGQKSLSREKRLKSAKRWLASYRGKNVVRGYRKWFGVSDVCAVLELRMLGVDIPDARLEQARRHERAGCPPPAVTFPSRPPGARNGKELAKTDVNNVVVTRR